MKRLLYALLLLLPGLLPGRLALADDAGYLPRGQMVLGEYRRLVPGFSTRDDVLEMFGPPDDEIDVKRKKFDRWTYIAQQDAMSACFPAGSKAYHLWKYDSVVPVGKKFRKRSHVYMAFHDDGRVCYTFETNLDF